MRYLIFILISITLVSCENKIHVSAPLVTAGLNTEKTVNIEDPIYKGLTNPIITTTKEAGKGLEYKLDLPVEMLQPNYLKYIVDDGIQFVNAVYNINKEEVISFLPIEIEYNFDEKILNGENKDNDFVIAQYDFNKDGINEIVFIFKDNNNTDLGLQIDIIKYKTPPKDEVIFCDYWLELKKIHIKEFPEDVKIEFKDHEILLSDGQKFTISKEDFKNE